MVTASVSQRWTSSVAGHLCDGRVSERSFRIHVARDLSWHLGRQDRSWPTDSHGNYENALTPLMHKIVGQQREQVIIFIIV